VSKIICPLPKNTRSNSIKWTEAKVSKLFELVLDSIKDVPESFEKPTAQKFYARIIERSIYQS